MPMTCCLIHRCHLVRLIATAASTAMIGAVSNPLPFKPSPVPGGVAIVPVQARGAGPCGGLPR